MKIAFVLHQFLPLYNTGTEQYAFHLGKSLMERGEELKVFCFEPRFEKNSPFTGLSRDDYEGIPVTRISGWPGLFPNIILSQYYNPFYGKLFGEYLREEGIELVHFFHNSFLGLSVVEEAYLLDIPMVVNLMDFWYLCPNIQLLKTHGGLCGGPDDYRDCIRCLAPLDGSYQALMPLIEGEGAVPLPQGAYERVEIDFLASTDYYHWVAAMAVRPHFIRRTLGLTDLIVSPSDFLKSVFVKNGYDPDALEVVRYGVTLDALKGLEKTKASRLRVGYIGTISAHKGLDVLIKAFREIEGEEISLEVHGDLGSFPTFASKVKSLAEGDDRIRFHGRFESPALPDVLKEIDVLVVPSVWYENTPFVILEALASGTPVIASDLGGLAELVEEGVNGFLFEVNNPEDLREKIGALNSDRVLLEGLRPDPSGVRSLEDNVEEFLEIYGRIKARKKAAAVR